MLNVTTTLLQTNCFRAAHFLRAKVTNAIRQAKRDFFMRGARSGSKFFKRHIKQATGFGIIKLIVQPWPGHDERSA